MKIRSGRIILKIFTAIKVSLQSTLLLSLLTSCLDEGSGSEGPTQVVAEPGEVAPPPLPLTPPERTVCDPFDAGGSASNRGLIGNLLYLTDDQPRYQSVNDLIENGTPIQSTLYFDRLYVPTRAFDLGFYTQSGTLILNHNDQPIYEYFALRLESQLTLAANENPGWYQMAVLADDGAILSRKNPDGSLTEIVNNDGTHATRMGCATQSIYMDRNSKIPIVMAYHQGPRYHIALTVLWRPLPDGASPTDPVSDIECNQQGNARYFDSTQVPSAPTTRFYEMLERGWKPLDNENYYFPEQAANPCAEADPLLITNFSLVSVTRTQVSVSWSSSLPSNSQVQVKNVLTGAITLSAVDPNLVTAHSATVTGLLPNTLYSVQAISQSPDGQITHSSESAFRTAR